MFSKLRYLYRALRYRLLVDPGELRFVRDCVRTGQVAVDVGCHKGAYTYWLRRAVGDSGEVIAFEPQPKQSRYLAELFGKLDYSNVRLVSMGLSDSPGQLPMFLPHARGATHEASFVSAKGDQNACDRIDVEVTTLDAFFADSQRGPNFVKIDVEGHELEVLRGGLETLRRHRPTLLVECEARHRPGRDVAEVFFLLETLGYRGSFFHRGQRRPMAEFRAEEHQPDLPDGQVPRRGYVNNFAFEFAGHAG
jgi:FkbM family methyltransferase